MQETSPKDEYAFPIPELNVWEGMGLRDYFAARAMQGLLANSKVDVKDVSDIGATAYLVADLMLEARHEDDNQ